MICAVIHPTVCVWDVRGSVCLVVIINNWQNGHKSLSGLKLSLGDTIYSRVSYSTVSLIWQSLISVKMTSFSTVCIKGKAMGKWHAAHFTVSHTSNYRSLCDSHTIHHQPQYRTSVWWNTVQEAHAPLTRLEAIKKKHQTRAVRPNKPGGYGLLTDPCSHDAMLPICLVNHHSSLMLQRNVSFDFCGTVHS